MSIFKVRECSLGQLIILVDGDMLLSDEQIDGLDVACNEADWVGLAINQQQSWAGITLAVLTLPVEGPAPADTRIQLILQPLVRLCASHRSGRWNDENAELVPLTIEQLERKVSDGQGAVYGWEFFNIPDKSGFTPWADRLSLHIGTEAPEPTNTINLCQDTDPFLEVRIWFRELRLFGTGGNEISMQDFIAGGKRWWDGLNRGDPRTQGAGIFPIDSERNT